MDYIREELLRQQEALTDLLLGTAEWNPAADSAPGLKEEKNLELPEVRTVEAGAKTGPLTAEIWTGTPPQSVGRPAQYDTREDELAAETVQRYWAFDGEGAQPLGRAATPQSSRELLTSRTVDLLWPVQDRRGSDARDISLALERDARRYDGGFSLY